MAPRWAGLILLGTAALGCTGSPPTASSTPTTSTTSTASPSPSPARHLEVTASTCLNIRAAPSLDAAVLGCAPSGTVLRQRGGPRTADGRRWLRVGGAWEGWAAAEFLKATDEPPTEPSPD
jgi:hypothetical protein